MLLKCLVSVPQIVKKGTLKAHFVGNIGGHEELVMDYNFRSTLGIGG
jgi:hypothetical protein